MISETSESGGTCNLSPEERYLREFSDYSDVELRRITEKIYHPEARRATAAPLSQRKERK